MRRLFHHAKIKTKHQGTSKEINMVDNISEIDGNLVVTLSSGEHKTKMETYLNVLKNDIQLDDHNRKVFTFEYKADVKSFIITPTSDVSIKDILEEIAAVNLLVPRAHTRRHTSK